MITPTFIVRNVLNQQKKSRYDRIRHSGKIILPREADSCPPCIVPSIKSDAVNDTARSGRTSSRQHLLSLSPGMVHLNPFHRFEVVAADGPAAHRLYFAQKYE